MKQLMLTLLLFHASVSLAEIAVVVPVDSPIQELTKQQVSNLFLSRTNRLADGKKAVLIETRNQKLRQEFYSQISNKTPGQLKSYWTTMIFTGKGRPPKSFASKQEVIDFMKHNTATVTYLDSSEITSDMKVVLRFSLMH